jgi:23S rRNA (cytosine1962-C5)-methyltransferase
MGVVRLAKPLERAVSEGHPWLYRDALAGFDAAPGDEITVLDRKGRFLGRGLADGGPIGVRVWTTQDESVSDALLRRRVAAARALRTASVPPDTDAYRLIHGEGDRMPGVVCDIYGAWAVLKLDGAGAQTLTGRLVESLEPTLRELGVRSLLHRIGRGPKKRTTALYGRPPDREVQVRELGWHLRADLVRGQKTGLFLDHRASRARARRLASGRRVLNLYGYTGGFSVAAGVGGATHVDTVDVAGAALELAAASWSDNDLASGAHVTHATDVAEFLDAARRRKATWDLVIADPPSFAPRAAAVRNALAGYRKLHGACLDVLSTGGVYLAASCSSHVDRAAFEESLRRAAHDRRRVVQIVDRWGAAPDHPTLLSFPEGDYLTVVLARIID